MPLRPRKLLRHVYALQVTPTHEFDTLIISATELACPLQFRGSTDGALGKGRLGGGVRMTGFVCLERKAVSWMLSDLSVEICLHPTPSLCPCLPLLPWTPNL